MLPVGVMRPILFPPTSVNHRLLSGPAVMLRSPQPSENPQFVGRGNSLILPAVVLRPILFPKSSVDQRLPSGPAVMPRGRLFFVLMRNSVMAPPVVLRPILPADSVNQRLPSGPVVMPTGPLLAVGMGNSVNLPLGVMRPISPTPCVISVNHRLPSGPAVMAIGALFVGMGNSVMVPAAAQVGRLLRLSRPTQASTAVRSAVRCDHHPERFMWLPPFLSFPRSFLLEKLMGSSFAQC